MVPQLRHHCCLAASPLLLSCVTRKTKISIFNQPSDAAQASQLTQLCSEQRKRIKMSKRGNKNEIRRSKAYQELEQS